MATPQKSSPVKLSLNDDRSEKAARLQSRQALHDIQMNQIKAAASPMRKMNGYDKNNEQASGSSPRTPHSAAALARDRDRGGKENTDPESSSSILNVLPSSSSALTPMKRVPILANFEEWMKMATDNKINATNSWNFALIDYFHDLSLLKEGDGVNFQKASCTLDGCVKIYTSRVDSVASETGKLLSGLADSGGGKKRGGRESGVGGEGEGEGGSGDEDEEGEGGRKKGKKRTQRSHEQTLAPSFASLQLKKLELEFAVDPLFKKASADFDEGGAKGLLLNHLSIDSEGRIVFDSSDDMTDVKSYPNSTQMQQTLVDPSTTLPQDTSDLHLLPDNQSPDQEIDLSSLAAKFFPDLSILSSQDICPSMKSFTLGDPTSDLNLPFLKAPEDWRETHKPLDTDKPLIDIPLGDNSGIFLNSSNAAGFDDDDDDDADAVGGFDLGPDVGFGEGGEAWAKDAALAPMLRVARADDGDLHEGSDGIAIGDFDPANPHADAYTVGLTHQPSHRGAESDPTANILSYFDAALSSTKAAAWAGPEHWRIRKIKAAQAYTSSATDAHPPVRARKEKEPFEIDFLSPLDHSLAELLSVPAASNSAISLPKAQWRTKGRNLLPDDRHFSSRSLLRLWLKPKAGVGRRRVVPDRGVAGTGGGEGDDMPRHTEMDENYWARRREEDVHPDRDRDEEGAKEADYDANFFADEDAALPFGGLGLPSDDEDDVPAFTDAREMLSPPLDGVMSDPQQPHPAPLDELSSRQNLPSEAGGAAAAGSADPQSHLLPTSFGSQLVTQPGAGSRRLRPEYVNYARVAKKVDVRRLKENMWRGMSRGLMSGFAAGEAEEEGGDQVEMPVEGEGELDGGAEGNGQGGAELRFTSLIRNLQAVYPAQQMRDISTSYCFICLLHLANEKGLVLEGDYPEGGARRPEQMVGGGKEEGGGKGGLGGGEEAPLTGLMREIRVRRDESVGLGYVGE